MKGETQDRYHLIACVHRTGSEVNVGEILLVHIELKRRQGLIAGPDISCEIGKLFTSAEIDEMLIEILTEMHEDNPNGFLEEVDTKESYLMPTIVLGPSGERLTPKHLTEASVDKTST